MAKSKPKCPICKSKDKPDIKNKLYPFCSERCRNVDLGSWVNEEYKVESDDQHSSDKDD